MMKSLLYTTLLGMMFSCAVPAVLAQDEEDSPKPARKVKADKKKKAASPVVTAVKKVKKVKGRLNDKADYFIYLYSASWCGPCCQEMPEIVETYKEIKKSGKVDIVLFCQDKTLADAKNFVKRFNIKFLTVMGDDNKVKKVPGHAPSGGIPHCIFVDRYGRTITAGHPGHLMSSWATHTIDNGEPEAPEEKE